MMMRNESFYGYDYIYEDNLTRAVTSFKYLTEGNCTQNNYVVANQINFSLQHVETYIFKFWNGNNNWITKTIVVE